jgi:hypothetical protein
MIRTMALSHAAEQTWRNGGGSTRELLTWPQAEDWWVRISVAQITRDGPFSAFAGVQRWFAVLQGDGVLLHLGETPTVLTPADPPLAFEGSAAPGCELLGGTTQDLNLMLRQNAGSGSMARAVAGDEWSSAAPLRAVYAQDAAWLQIDGGDALEMAADTLAWHEDAALQRWRLRAPGDDAVRALWMAFTPCRA